MRSFGAALLLLLSAPASQAFTMFAPTKSMSSQTYQHSSQSAISRHTSQSKNSAPTRTFISKSMTPSSSTVLHMGLDMVTYLRCEWVSAALCTNQTPRSADVCLQLGTEDGRPVTFIPRTIETFITSTVEADGILPISVERQVKQQEKSRGAAMVKIVNQRADDLKETADESVDVVLSLQAAARMKENGLDWKKSVQEAARVLKPGGRFLFVEQTMLDDDNYLEYVGNLGVDPEKLVDSDTDEENNDDEEEQYPVFECIGYDDVDLVLVPHVAAVFVKSEDAGLTPAERAAKEAKVEQERMAEVSISAFERGLKKRKRKKKKSTEEAS
ncbi:methyltransferase domain containing protein [Nitzschia inconspicua]|uniref:Methyltransferase domain containing protein n=1 Tax=Nitzschia inconspicua TaxID=303405 RepID=A0A9K3KMJ6_9STRA|nr:methyltransferase domain containing protein [Nitzschia inconspicua]